MEFSDFKTVGEQSAFAMGQAVALWCDGDTRLQAALGRQYAHIHAMSVFPRLDYARGYNRLLTAFRAGAKLPAEIKL